MAISDLLGLYVVRASVDFSFFILRIITTKTLFFKWLYLVKLEYAFSYKKGFLSYTYPKLNVSKMRINLLESQILFLLERIEFPVPYVTERPGSQDLLVVVSDLQDVGGHSRVVNFVLKHYPATNLYVSCDIRKNRRKSIYNELNNYLNNNKFVNMKNNRFANIQKGSGESIIIEHLNGINSLNPHKILLFNSGSDIFLLVAMVLLKKSISNIKIIYYHHGDDYLQMFDWFFDKHIDFNYNQKKCNHITDRTVVRMSTKNRKRIGDISTSSFTIMSYSPYYKIEDFKKEFPFLKYVAELCKFNCKIILVCPKYKKFIFSKLREYGCAINNVNVINGYRDIVDYNDKIHMYLDSFPVGGGMSTLEALSIGIPVVIHNMENYQVLMDEVLIPFSFSAYSDSIDFIYRLKNDQKYYNRQCMKAYSIFENYYSSQVVYKEFAVAINNT
jgi:hypothetical protein